MESTVKKYKDRDQFLFYVIERRIQKWVLYAKCSCGKSFKIKGDSYKCPSCGIVLDEEYAVKIDHKGYKTFNTHTHMFVDDHIVTISFLMGQATRVPNTTFVAYEHGRYNQRIRFDTKKRTAVMYLSNPTKVPDYIWNGIRSNGKFINFTQPLYSYYPGDIKLDPELVRDFCNIIGVKAPKEEVSINDLAWINRTRKTLNTNNQISERLKLLQYENDRLYDKLFNIIDDLVDFNYLRIAGMDHEMTETIGTMMNAAMVRNKFEMKKNNTKISKCIAKIKENLNNDYPNFQKIIADFESKSQYIKTVESAIRAYKKKIKKGEADIYDEQILSILFNSFSAGYNEISKKIKEIYYEKPNEIRKHGIRGLFFHNMDYLEESLKYECDSYRTVSNPSQKRENIIFLFTQIAKAENEKTISEDEIEKTILNLIKKGSDPISLIDAAEVYKRLYEKGIKIKFPTQIKSFEKDIYNPINTRYMETMMF